MPKYKLKVERTIVQSTEIIVEMDENEDLASIDAEMANHDAEMANHDAGTLKWKFEDHRGYRLVKLNKEKFNCSVKEIKNVGHWRILDSRQDGDFR